MKKYFKFWGIAFVATAFCVAFASCSDKDDNSTSDGGGITPAGYVDLGLPSGTKWKVDNETNTNDEYDFYTYEEAMSAFGNKLPTKEQFMELRNLCEWIWTGKGYIVCSNGKYITFPATGYRTCNGNVRNIDTIGDYWSSTLGSSDYAWYLNFSLDTVRNVSNRQCYGRSVRLVKD